MVFSTNTKFTTLTPNGRQTTTVNTSSLAVALKASQQFYSAARIKGKYSGLLNSLARTLNRALEAVLITELGGGRIQEGRGGFFPDYFIKLEDDSIALREVKLSATVDQGDKVVRQGSIKIGGGAGLLIRRGNMELVTGFVTSETGVEAEKEILPTTRLFNALIKNKDNQAGLVRVLSGSDKAAIAIRTTLSTKANTIDIPVIFQGRLENRSITFTWKDIANAALTKKGKITVVDNRDDSINLNFAFFGSTITKALNNMDKVIVTQLNGKLGQTVLRALAEQISIPGPGVAQEIRKLLRELGFEYALQYIPGSAKIVSGKIALSKRKKEDKEQGFISGVQWTILTQKRLGETMKNFGPPNPPNLKERTGRFRSSVQVAANYRKNILTYTYLPLYQSLERYGYKPNIQVETAIREVAQSLYTRRFNIRKV
jgi:hypothetical protein